MPIPVVLGDALSFLRRKVASSLCHLPKHLVAWCGQGDATDAGLSDGLMLNALCFFRFGQLSIAHWLAYHHRDVSIQLALAAVIAV